MNRTLAAESALLLLLVSMLGRGWIPAARATEEAQRRVTGSAAAQHPAANDQKDQPDGPWIASQSLLAGRPELAAPTVSNAEPWSIPGGISRSAMIAIVPDPVRTHLALTFDRTIEAIQLAASRNSYDADRYWLPWRTTAGRDGEALNASTEPAEPGLLLFRADAP